MRATELLTSAFSYSSHFQMPYEGLSIDLWPQMKVSNDAVFVIFHRFWRFFIKNQHFWKKMYLSRKKTRGVRGARPPGCWKVYARAQDVWTGSCCHQKSKNQVFVIKRLYIQATEKRRPLLVYNWSNWIQWNGSRGRFLGYQVRPPGGEGGGWEVWSQSAPLW